MPKEYDKGTADGRVTIPFEVQEAVAFMDGVEAAFSDLEPVLLDRDPAAVEPDQGRPTRSCATTSTTPSRTSRSRRRRSSRRPATALPRPSNGSRRRSGPNRATKPTTNSSTSRSTSSKRRPARASYQAAEQARLAAYGFFEFGPELKLRAFDPQLALEIEGLIWYGANGDSGLATLVADDAPLSEIRETRLDLDEKLDDARALTGDGASAMTTITNSALIVFREGLEAILILAAITASMIGAAGAAAASRSTAAPCSPCRPAS